MRWIITLALIAPLVGCSGSGQEAAQSKAIPRIIVVDDKIISVNDCWWDLNLLRCKVRNLTGTPVRSGDVVVYDGPPSTSTILDQRMLGPIPPAETVEQSFGTLADGRGAWLTIMVTRHEW